jgi:hypothetical protein
MYGVLYLRQVKNQRHIQYVVSSQNSRLRTSNKYCNSVLHKGCSFKSKVTCMYSTVCSGTLVTVMYIPYVCSGKEFSPLHTVSSWKNNATIYIYMQRQFKVFAKNLHVRCSSYSFQNCTFSIYIYCKWHVKIYHLQ